MLASVASSLTARRLRAHGSILALCLWSVYLWNMATPGLLDRSANLKGTDFLHFYTLGSLALAHRGADLYNLQAQSAVSARRVPQAAGIVYLPLYPPQVSLFFAPLAHLNYAFAVLAWLCFSSLIYFLCCYSVWRSCPNLRSHALTVLILALAFPAFWHLIAWGQTSALVLACFTLAYFALRAQREFLAGLALGFLIFKPQLGIAAAIVFVLVFRWKVIVGALLSVSSQLTAAWLYYGPGPLLCATYPTCYRCWSRDPTKPTPCAPSGPCLSLGLPPPLRSTSSRRCSWPRSRFSAGEAAFLFPCATRRYCSQPFCSHHT